jgi:hypothetical protein
LKRFLARQTIFNSERAVFGYELPYRSGAENFYDAVHAEMASASAMDSLLLFGIDWHFQDRPDWKPVIALADFINVDLLTTSPEDQLRLARAYLPMKIRMLAEKVETYEDFHRTQQWGLFSRLFLQAAGNAVPRRYPSNKLNYLLVLHAVNREQMDVRGRPLRQESVGVTYALCRFHASAGLGLVLGQHHDEPRHFFWIHRRAVHDHCVGRAHQRRRRAALIASVAFANFFKGALQINRVTLLLMLAPTPRGARFGRSGQENFQLGVGKNHTADVAAFHHHAALLSRAPLFSYQHVTHAWVHSNLGSRLRYLRRANRGSHILVVEEYALRAVFCAQVNSRFAC